MVRFSPSVTFWSLCLDSTHTYTPGPVRMALVCDYTARLLAALAAEGL